MRGILIVLVFLFSLNLSLAATVSGEGQVILTTSSNNITCTASPNLAYWTNVSSSQIFNVYNSTFQTGNCSLYNDATGLNCCPTNMECQNSRCVASNTVYCRDLTTEQACTSAAWDVVERSVEQIFNNQTLCWEQESTTSSCLEQTVCFCKWNQSYGSGGGCTIVNYTRTAMGLGGPTCTVSSNTGTCQANIQMSEDHCDDPAGGYLSMITTYQGSGANCPVGNTTARVPCSATIKLPFFTWFNFMSSVLGIALVYFILNRKNN